MRSTVPTDFVEKGTSSSATRTSATFCTVPRRFRTLTRSLPQCRWFYLCSDESATVLRGRRDLADVLPLVSGEDSWTLKPGGFAALRKHDFDVAQCTNTLRHYPDLLLSAALGIPNRVGYNYKGCRG